MVYSQCWWPRKGGLGKLIIGSFWSSHSYRACATSQNLHILLWQHLMLSETFYLLKINITFIKISDQFLLSRYSFVTHSSCCRTCSPHGIAFIKQQILHRRIIHNICKAIRRISMLIMRLKGYIYNVFFFCLLAVSESDLVFALVQSPAVLCCSRSWRSQEKIYFFPVLFIVIIIF